jgi:hypothetical protein
VEDQLLRAKETGDDPTTNPNAYRLRAVFGRTYYQYKPQYAPFWLSVILGERM